MSTKINRFINEPQLRERIALPNFRQYFPTDVWTRYTERKHREGAFSGKIVIVTGASSGIGKAIAIEFASQGANLVLAARNTIKLRETERQIKTIGADYLSIATDVRQLEDCEHLIKQTLHRYGKIDILINNAGISMRANFADLDLKVLEELMQTNFWGTVYCTKAAIPHILRQKGSIIGISSITGLTPLPGRTGYAASKHAMDGFLNTLRVENMNTGLHVMVVHPGFTSSNIRNTALNAQGNAQGNTPRDERKMMSAEELAKIIAKTTRQRRHNLVLTPEGRAIVWFYKRFPAFTERVIYWQMSKEPNSPF